MRGAPRPVSALKRRPRCCRPFPVAICTTLPAGLAPIIRQPRDTTERTRAPHEEHHTSHCRGLLLAAGAVVPAAADEIADFYKGKSVNIVVGHEPATGFDVYARVLRAPSWPPHPGQSEHRRAEHDRRERAHRRQLALQRRAQGRHGDGHLRAHHSVRAADGQQRGALRARKICLDRQHGGERRGLRNLQGRPASRSSRTCSRRRPSGARPARPARW